MPATAPSVEPSTKEPSKLNFRDPSAGGIHRCETVSTCSSVALVLQVFHLLKLAIKTSADYTVSAASGKIH